MQKRMKIICTSSLGIFTPGKEYESKRETGGTSLYAKDDFGYTIHLTPRGGDRFVVSQFGTDFAKFKKVKPELSDYEKKKKRDQKYEFLFLIVVSILLLIWVA